MSTTALSLAPPAGARIALVGAAGGIGKAVTDALLEAGCTVIALDLPRSLEAGDLPAGVDAYPIDATDEAAVTAAFAAIGEAHGALDGLVQLAGFTAARQTIGEIDRATWDEVVTGNLNSTFLIAKAALPLLMAGRDPSMVLISSGLAVKATPGYGPYAAAKAGVLSMTKLLAAENAPTVRVNAVAPSAVETPFLSGGTGREATGSAFDREGYSKTVPLGRMAEAADIVGPILFLLGPAAGYVTGQTLHVNGGLLMP